MCCDFVSFLVCEYCSILRCLFVCLFVSQKVWRDGRGNMILGVTVSINQLCLTSLVMSLTTVFKITFCK